MRVRDEHAGFEKVAVRRGPRSRALMAVAIHSTRLGPALGGARMWHYDDPGDAVADAKRLASAMTLKAAAAGLDLGGGKGVIAAPSEQPPEGSFRRALLLDFGDLVESLGGRYITAEDVGTGAEDMAVIAERTGHVVGLDRDHGGSGDPSPLTAIGVRAAMRASARARLGSGDLDGRTVSVIGLGHVGSELARLLARDGARLRVADIDPGKRRLAERLGAEWVEPSAALAGSCDVLAPCALGGLLDERTVERLDCAIVCGAANNVLVDVSIADELAGRGILYAPDFIANAGGLISVYGELRGYERERAMVLAAGIERTMDEIFEAAGREGTTPLEAARRRAAARLRPAAARRLRSARQRDSWMPRLRHS
jgi:leucine dehydrogenase